MTTTSHRAAESAGMMLIGDAVLTLIKPSEHCLLWRGGPAWWREAVDWFSQHPNRTRILAVAELGTGLWLALQQQPQDVYSPAAERDADRVPMS